MECLDVQSYWDKYMGFADYMVAPQQQVFPAGSLSPEIACLAEPTAVSIDMVAVADVGPDDRGADYRAGPLGLLDPECMRRGVKHIWMAGRSHSQAPACVWRRNWAPSPFLSNAISPSMILAGAGPRAGVLVVVLPSELLVAAKVGAVGSIISYIGFAWTKEGMITLDADTFHDRRQQLRSSMARPGTRAAEALELLASGIFDPSSVVAGELHPTGHRRRHGAEPRRQGQRHQDGHGQPRVHGLSL